jgi:peptidyl-prolyl cis-trans isomerase C
MKRLVTLAAALTIALPVLAEPVATVNGQAIPKEKLDQFVSLLVEQGAKDSPELRTQVKQEMVNRLVAVQAAEKAGIDKKPEVQQELELARQGILVRALMSDHLEKHPITDKQVQAEYDKFKKAQAGTKEYKLSHILVKEKADADALLADIKAKKITFEAAAKEKSIDPGSGKNGGDLGWGPATNYVPEFASAVEAMKKGQMSDAPVKTQFGWHIIKVDDMRDAKFPELDEVKPQIQEMLRKKALAEYQQDLMKKATIK